MKCAACGYDKEEGWKRVELSSMNLSCFVIREYGAVKLFACPICMTVRVG